MAPGLTLQTTVSELSPAIFAIGEDTPENSRDKQFRMPKRKLDHNRAARAAKRANTGSAGHENDKFRRGVFAGLCAADPKHKLASITLAEAANAVFSAGKLPALSERTAQRWRQEYELNKENFDSGPHYQHQGHCKFSEGEIKQMRNKFLEHAFGARKVKRELANEGIAVSTTYLRDLRHSASPPIVPHKLKHKPGLTERQMEYRIEFCQLHVNDPWHIWVFSDEFTVDITLGKCLIWNSQSADDVPTIPTHKNSARFHVFAAVSYDLTLTLRFYSAAMNSVEFTQMLDNAVFPEIQQLRNGIQCVFQHDNGPIYTSKATQEFLSHHALVRSKLIKTLKPGEWPAYSPDLNLIENLMAHVKTEVEVRFLEERNLEPSVDEWKEALQREWHRVPAWKIHNYFNSMPKRCQDCIERDGRPLNN